MPDHQLVDLEPPYPRPAHSQSADREIADRQGADRKRPQGQRAKRDGGGEFRTLPDMKHDRADGVSIQDL